MFYICFAYGHGAKSGHLSYNTIHKDFYDFRKENNEIPFYNKPMKKMMMPKRISRGR